MLKDYLMKRSAKQVIIMLAKSEAKIALVAFATVLTQQLVQKLLQKIYALPYFQKNTTPA